MFGAKCGRSHHWHAQRLCGPRSLSLLLMLTVLCSQAISDAGVAEDEAHLEVSVHGMCANVMGEPSAGALYDAANRLTAAQCDASEIVDVRTNERMNWTRFRGQLYAWLQLPVEAWPWEEVVDTADFYTQCGCECTDGTFCSQLFHGCPAGFWAAAMLHCAAVGAAAADGPGAEHASRRCEVMDPLGSLFTNTTLYFPFQRLFDVLVSGWPIFTLLLKLGALAVPAKAAVDLAFGVDNVSAHLENRSAEVLQATEALQAAVSLVPRASTAGSAEALSRLRYRVADAEARICSIADRTPGSSGSAALLEAVAFKAVEPLRSLALLEQRMDTQFSVGQDTSSPTTVCPALPFWEQQGVSFEEAAFVTELDGLLMEEVSEHYDIENPGPLLLPPSERTPSSSSTSSPLAAGCAAHAGLRKEAWATYIIPNSEIDVHLESVRTLAFSVRSVELRKRPFLVLTLGDLPAHAGSQLEQDGLEIHPLDVDAFQIHHKSESRWWEERGVVQTLARLTVFNLTQFDRVVVLEGDMVMKRPCDSLFDIPVFASGYELGGGPRGDPGLNTGIMVITPNAKFFKNMIDFAYVENWDKHYLAKKFNTDQTLLDIFWFRISDRLGVVHFDEHGCFLGCADVEDFRGGPSNMTNLGAGRDVHLTYKANEDRNVHCLLPLEFNYYADFKHMFLFGYRHSFTSGNKVSVGAFPTHFEVKEFHTIALRGPILDRAARWIVGRGLLRGPPRVIHWPGRVRKPWQRWLPRSRSTLDEQWWELHARMCSASSASCRFSCSAAPPPAAGAPASAVNAGIVAALVDGDDELQDELRTHYAEACFLSPDEAEACCCDPPRGVGAALCWSGSVRMWDACCRRRLESLSAPALGTVGTVGDLQSASYDCLRSRWRINPVTARGHLAMVQAALAEQDNNSGHRHPKLEPSVAR